MKTCSGYWPDRGTPCQRILRDGVCPKQGEPDHGYYNGGHPADPRWDWVDVSTMSQPDQWIKGECRHLTPDPVLVNDPVTDTKILVAWYCPDCDGQFAPDRFSREDDPFSDEEPPDWTVWKDLPAPNGFERWAYAPYAGLVLPETEEDLAALKSRFTGDERLMVLPPGATVTPLKDGYRRWYEDRVLVTQDPAPPPWTDRVWAAFVSTWEWMKEHHWVGWVWAGSTLVLAAVTGQLEGWK